MIRELILLPVTVTVDIREVLQHRGKTCRGISRGNDAICCRYQAREDRPPKGERLRKELQHERTALTGQCYQLLSGQTASGANLYNRLRKIPSDRCWYCGWDGKQTHHHLFVRCEAWRPQIRTLWRSVVMAGGTFLRGTRVGESVFWRPWDTGREKRNGVRRKTQRKKREMRGCQPPCRM